MHGARDILVGLATLDTSRLAANEAMAAGMTIGISSDVGPVPGLLRDGSFARCAGDLGAGFVLQTLLGDRGLRNLDGDRFYRFFRRIYRGFLDGLEKTIAIQICN